MLLHPQLLLSYFHIFMKVIVVKPWRHLPSNLVVMMGDVAVSNYFIAAVSSTAPFANGELTSEKIGQVSLDHQLG